MADLVPVEEVDQRCAELVKRVSRELATLKMPPEFWVHVFKEIRAKNDN